MIDPVDYRRVVPAAAVVSHPAPEVCARPAAVDEICAGAHRVYRAAEKLGWLVLPTYARGTTVDQYGKPGRLIHSLALRMRLPGSSYRAAAVWTAAALSDPTERKWSSDGAYAWVAGHMPRMLPLTAGRKAPEALSFAAYLEDPSRLTYPSTDGSVSGDEGSST